MKYFEKDGKYNWVDKNNVFVGYDSYQSCCENADWFISTKEEEKIGSDGGHNIDQYQFDTGYFEDVDAKDIDEGGMVRFRLIANGLPSLYLHLYNSHNGYYGHGFSSSINGVPWEAGNL